MLVSLPGGSFFSVPVASGYACAVSLTSAHADGAQADLQLIHV